ncbi:MULTISPECIES: hypothetical protein [unclassified Nitrobacter]|uniref:hypothetical protein n=1 Tax=unclassified Nitrobacter TaxID=2620411 RepID=UPI0009282DD8|nr:MULTISPECIES: hypothetical protein [unclassified Nitrobacter]MBN9149781.1 hypothetical protein [Nitrobacter sp.]OJV02716.1 MAG: hypothetical protein BGO16_01715 [Nitrobacter sp. 62-23]
MDRDTLDRTITTLLDEIHSHLSEATRIAKAAQACANAGSVTEGIEVSMDIEQLIHEAGRLHDAISLLDGMRREST